MPAPSHLSLVKRESPQAVLDYWLARLPRMSQTFGRRPPTGANTSRSIVRLPVRAGIEAIWIRWPPGSVSPLHDHGSSSSLVGMLHGSLSEVVHAAGIGVRARRTWTPEHSIELPAHECHEVRNVTNTSAASVHVYPAPLSGLRFYQQRAPGKLEPITPRLTPHR